MELDSISKILFNIEDDTLFFSYDSKSFKFPEVISNIINDLDSTNLVSEYSLNDKAIELMASGIEYLFRSDCLICHGRAFLNG